MKGKQEKKDTTKKSHTKVKKDTMDKLQSDIVHLGKTALVLTEAVNLL
jgi:hypothetical protein